MKIKRFNEYLKEDASTTASVGSGTALSSNTSNGSFTSAMGVSVSGGDSGTSFSTNSTMNGMGAIISAQPSDTPGDVNGSTTGSGDISSVLNNVYTKGKLKKKKKNKEDKYNDVENIYIKTFSDMYTENVKTEKFNFVGLKKDNYIYIYVIPYNSDICFNIGYFDTDDSIILYNKFNFNKENINDLNIIELPNNLKIKLKEFLSEKDLKTIENFIKYL